MTKTVDLDDWVWRELTQLKVTMGARRLNDVVASMLVAGRAKREHKPLESVVKEMMKG